MDRLVNYFFIFALISVFVLDAQAAAHYRIFLGALFSVVFCLVAFVLNWLSLDGARAGAVLGTLVFGLGGFPVTFLILFFFLSSTLISREDVTPGETSEDDDRDVRRDGLQVWSNGFWFSALLLLGFVTDAGIFWEGAISALATATADTWASELGSRRFRRTRTWSLNGFRAVRPGTDGGISIPGTLAAAAGSMIIAFFAIYLFSLHISSFFIIFGAGFLGSLADSCFGAWFQQPGKTFSLPHYKGVHKESLQLKVDNNMVNWLATGFGSLVAIILTLVF